MSRTLLPDLSNLSLINNATQVLAKGKRACVVAYINQQGILVSHLSEQTTGAYNHWSLYLCTCINIAGDKPVCLGCY